ncbi:MAG: hypothetical protein ACFB2W_04005 [Leptolyngbyaceae cyanobacterium]
MTNFNRLITILEKNNWWLSIFFAIPLAVAANLITPKVQSFFETRSKEAALEQLELLSEQLTRTEFFANSPQEFNQYLLAQLITIALLGAILQISSVLLPAAFPIIKNKYARISLLVISQSIIVIISLIIIFITRDALSDYYRVANFDEYKESLQERVDSIKGDSELTPEVSD